jgi:peptidoglycan/LPS O-acetylase OafA/YrhL
MERLSNLDVFRAVAALAVCFHHFNRETLTGGTIFSRVAEYGNFGVDIFFVISGYVIPLALLRRNFRIGESAIFLKARFLRLYPAYLVAALLTVGLWYGSTLLPGFRGEGGPHITVANALANLTLTCDFFRQDWFGVVFWTLAIEAQYYVLVAVCFGALFSVSRAGDAARFAVLAAWLLPPLYFQGGATVFGWTALFAMGILALQWQRGMIGSNALIAGLIAAAAVQFEARGVVSAVLGLGTALGILFLPNLNLKRLAWVGGISYSLYLLHVPVGGRVMNLLERYADSQAVRALSVPLALAASVVAAWLFFRLVEKPSHEAAQRLSASFRSRNEKLKASRD